MTYTRTIVQIAPAVTDKLADRHTQTDRQTDCNNPLRYRGSVITKILVRYNFAIAVRAVKITSARTPFTFSS